jgi:hypothetical protein
MHSPINRRSVCTSCAFSTLCGGFFLGACPTPDYTHRVPDRDAPGLHRVVGRRPRVFALAEPAGCAQPRSLPPGGG